MNTRFEYYTRERYGLLDRMPANEVAEKFLAVQGGKVLKSATCDAARALGFELVAVANPRYTST